MNVLTFSDIEETPQLSELPPLICSGAMIVCPAGSNATVIFSVITEGANSSTTLTAIVPDDSFPFTSCTLRVTSTWVPACEQSKVEISMANVLSSIPQLSVLFNGS